MMVDAMEDPEVGRQFSPAQAASTYARMKKQLFTISCRAKWCLAAAGVAEALRDGWRI